MKVPTASVGKIVKHSVPNNAPTQPSLPHSAAVTRNGPDGTGSRSPITHNGIHPITRMRPQVEKRGEAGSSKDVKPKTEDVKRMGATTHHSPEDSKPNDKLSKQVAQANAKSGESKSHGTTSASDGKKKSMAEIMYPQRKGLRGMVLEQ